MRRDRRLLLTAVLVGLMLAVVVGAYALTMIHLGSLPTR